MITGRQRVFAARGEQENLWHKKSSIHRGTKVRSYICFFAKQDGQHLLSSTEFKYPIRKNIIVESCAKAGPWWCIHHCAVTTIVITRIEQKSVLLTYYFGQDRDICGCTGWSRTHPVKAAMFISGGGELKPTKFGAFGSLGLVKYEKSNFFDSKPS